MRGDQQVYDAVIVGSGANGGWVAKEVSEQGMTVLLLEAGPPRLPTRDFAEHVWPYQVKFRGFGNQKAPEHY
jgi:choline dehydrogenase-like flavoprotein